MWQLTTYSSRYIKTPELAPHCVLISGWSYGGDVFEWMLAAFGKKFHLHVAQVDAITQKASFDDFADSLYEKIAEKTEGKIWLVGWSLGGNVALEIAAKYSESIAGVSVFATTPVFVAKDDFPAMQAEVFAKFMQGLQHNANKTLKRFDVLVCSGDTQEKALRSTLQDYREQTTSMWNEESLIQGLEFLEKMDQRHLLGQLKVPVQWLLAENDALVNAKAVNILKEFSHIQAEVFDNVSHAGLLSDSDDFLQTFFDFYHAAKARRINAVAQSFSAAAGTYDQSSQLQKNVAEKLLSLVDADNAVTLDVGCGTGLWTKELLNKSNIVYALDLSQSMLKFAKNNYQVKNTICADMQYLPFTDNSFDIIFSSLAIQWLEDLPLFIKQCEKILKKGGKLHIATLLDGTLAELKQSFAKADNDQHVNNFLQEQVVLDACNTSALNVVDSITQAHVMYYEQAIDLMKDLKGIGANTVENALHNQRKGLLGKTQWQKVHAAYESYRDQQGLPATYQVLYLTLEKQA